MAGFHPLIVGAECPAVPRVLPKSSPQVSIPSLSGLSVRQRGRPPCPRGRPVSIPSLSGLSVRPSGSSPRQRGGACFHPLIVGAECPARQATG